MYASLKNFDQLSIRRSWAAYSGFQIGWTGLRFNRILACSGVRSAFRLLHSRHASTQLFQRDSPPWARGMTWSSVSSSVPGCLPQYWHV